MAKALTKREAALTPEELDVNEDNWHVHLSAQEQRFVIEWLKCMDLRKAARKAGYADTVAETAVYQWVRNREPTKPWLKAAMNFWIVRRNQEAMLSVHQVVGRVKAIAFGDMRDVAKWKAHRIEDEEPGDDGIVRVATSNTLELIDSDDLTDDQAATVKSIKQDKDGNVSVELHSPLPALTLLAKMVGLAPDVVLTNPAPAGSGIKSDMSPAEAAEAWRAMLRGDGKG